MHCKVTKTGSFIAVDFDGQQRTVSEWTVFQASGIGDGGEVQWKPHSQIMRLDTGYEVKLLDDGTVQVVLTGMRLRRL